MKRKIYVLFLVIAVMVCVTGGCYLKNRDMLFFIEKPTMEVNSQFDYQKYIKEVKKGTKDDVTCDSQKLDISKLGQYEVIYQYRNKKYPLVIQVVDTTKPELNMSSSLTVLMNTKPDLKRDLEVKDNSQMETEVTIDSSGLDMSKEGEYVARYIAKDSSGNKVVKNRTIKVVKEYGRSEPTQEKIIYLTFDDGPSQNTKRILDILDKYHAKATFFVTGTNQKYNYLIKEAHDKGHTIGLHSYCHEYEIIYSSVAAYFNDLTKIGDMVKEIIGYRPHYIRFPGGSSNQVSRKYNTGIMSVLTKEVIKRGYQYYDWNGETGDAEGNHVPTQTIIHQATIKDDTNIMMLAHDTDAKDTTVQALPAIIEYYQKKGYVFKAIDDESFYAHQSIHN